MIEDQGNWLAFGSRDRQLWLKVLLTKEAYEAVEEGEARAEQARLRAEWLAMGFIHRFRPLE